MYFVFNFKQKIFLKFNQNQKQTKNIDEIIFFSF